MEGRADELPCFAEAELMEAAYGPCFRLCDPTGFDGVIFTVDLEMLEGVLKISIPSKYPAEPLRFNLDGKFTHAEGKVLRLDLNQYACETAHVGSFDLCQRATDLLRDLQDSKLCNATSAKPVYARKQVSIARFLVYFHHIMSGAKRAYIQDCADYLSLGGFSKPGYPGIVVVEGDKLDVMEWVNRVQRLRWKHMVVRGEQIESLFEASTDNDHAQPYIAEAEARQLIDIHRKLPPLFLGELADTSEAGRVCESCGIHDLYLTAMKIYSASSDDTEITDT